MLGKLTTKMMMSIRVISPLSSNPISKNLGLWDRGWEMRIKKERLLAAIYLICMMNHKI